MSNSQNQQNSADSSEGLDPELTELLGENSGSDKPEFSDLFEEENPQEGEDSSADTDQTSHKKAFPTVEVFELQKPLPYLKDKNYYKKVLSNEGEEAQKLHKTLSMFLKAKDPQEKSMHRGRLIPAYWNLFTRIAMKIYKEVPPQKVFALRFGALLPTVLSPEQRLVVSKIPMKNPFDEPVYYVDEWLKTVAHGVVSTSAVDETKTKKRSEDQKIMVQLEKVRGKREVQSGLVKGKLREIDSLEYHLADNVKTITNHHHRPGFEGLQDGYEEEQRNSLTELINISRKLLQADRELNTFFDGLETANNEYLELKQQADSVDDSMQVDDSGLKSEINTVRQMAKMCVGRQGNHFPFLMHQYFRPNFAEIVTRENVIKAMTDIEKIDPSIFLRTFKRQTNRIVPHVILLPVFGETGICWEPFERFNRATSRGRIAIPMYPKDFKVAVLSALGDLRWQVAKEKAQHYWMEEGLTGRYYQMFTETKQKGDVKDAFVQDYVLWIEKESEGTQKLSREARPIFWRYIPFPQKLKDTLKKRGFVYNELYKKDENIARSDGY